MPAYVGAVPRECSLKLPNCAGRPRRRLVHLATIWVSRAPCASPFSPRRFSQSRVAYFRSDSAGRDGHTGPYSVDLMALRFEDHNGLVSMGSGSEYQRVVLIAEDENIVAKDIAESLDRLGYRVAAVVTSGREAVEQAARVKPDLVLMDVNLRGDLDGIGAASALRDVNGPPVVFLTAFSDVETLKRAVESEPLGYLVKPFREAELRCVLAVALDRAQGRR